MKGFGRSLSVFIVTGSRQWTASVRRHPEGCQRARSRSLTPILARSGGPMVVTGVRPTA